MNFEEFGMSFEILLLEELWIFGACQYIFDIDYLLVHYCKSAKQNSLNFYRWSNYVIAQYWLMTTWSSSSCILHTNEITVCCTIRGYSPGMDSNTG